MSSPIRDVKYKPEDETVPQYKGSELEEGYVKDDRDFYEAGESERKDEYGNVVSHQDSKSFPGPRGLGTF